jgi:hypothetical protein
MGVGFDKNLSWEDLEEAEPKTDTAEETTVAKVIEEPKQEEKKEN